MWYPHNLMISLNMFQANEMWVHDAMNALTNVPEQEFADFLDHPEKYLV